MKFSSEKTGQNRWQKPVTTPQSNNLADWLRTALEDHRNNPLLLTNGVWLTGKDLLQRANFLANQIRAMSIQPGALVAICLAREAELVPALIATIQIGSTFLLLDPDHPSDRNNRILEDCMPALLIIGAEGNLRDPSVTKKLVPEINLTAQSFSEWTKRPAGTPTYLIYTSGSTGQPKGVLGRGRPTSETELGHCCFSCFECRTGVS